jgi:excisionase family DNA binding protein
MSPRQPRLPDSRRTTTSTSAHPETSQPSPGPAAERLAYSVDEVAHLTGLSRDLLYDEMRRGNLSYVKIGRRRVIAHEHLKQFLGLAPKRLITGQDSGE